MICIMNLKCHYLENYPSFWDFRYIKETKEFLFLKHLNAFNTLVSQIGSVNITIAEEDKCITLLFSLPDSWDNLVVEIGSTTQSTLNYEDVVASLLLKR